MLFNIHRGQKRIRGGVMTYIPKSPRSKLIMQDWDGGLPRGKKEYIADKLGNIDVTGPRHIETMVGLGYPIYNGDGKLCPVPLDDLLFPSINPKSEYWNKINQASGKAWK